MEPTPPGEAVPGTGSPGLVVCFLSFRVRFHFIPFWLGSSLAAFVWFLLCCACFPQPAWYMRAAGLRHELPGWWERREETAVSCGCVRGLGLKIRAVHDARL